MERIVEPELMEREDQVISYAKADFSEGEKNLINQIKWENGFFRGDIGYKVID